MIFITSGVLKILHVWLNFVCAKFEINFYSLAKLASEAQNPLAKMEFLLVCG